MTSTTTSFRAVAGSVDAAAGRTWRMPRIRLPRGTSSLPTGSAAMAVAVVAQTAANLAFHGVAGRSLTGAQYGALGTLLGLAVMVTVPLGSLQAAMNRAAALAPNSSPRQALGRVAQVALVLSLVVAVAAVPLQAYLHLPSLTVTLLLAPYLFQATVLAAARGALLGEGRATAVAATMGLATVLRLVAGAVLTPRFGITGAMVATVGAEVAGLVAVLVLVARGARRTQGQLQLTARDLGGSGLAVGGLWLFTSIDMLLARHHLAASAAGGYVAAATLAKCAMALPVALVMVALPRFTGTDVAAARRSLHGVLRVVTAVAVAGALPLIVAPEPFQHLLFGSQVAPANLVRVLAAISILSSVATTITYFHLAQGRRAALIPWVGALVEIALISASHASAGRIALGSALATVPTLAVLAWSVRPAALVSPAPATGPDETDPVDPEPTSQRLWSPADPNVELSVVLPFLNPGASVGRTIDRSLEVLRAAGISFEIIAVSDGSDDGSERFVPTHEPEVHLLVSPVNEGKGAAVQRGLASSRGAVCGFIDADGDIDPDHLVHYFRLLRAGDHDLVYASKRHRGSRTEASLARRTISLTYSTLVSGLFRLGVNDTQTGAKLMRREVAAAVLRHAQERRFAFDLELFVLADRFGFRRIEAAPVHLGERLAGSTVTRSAVVRTFRDTLSIWARAHVQGAYPPASAVARVHPTAVGAPQPAPVLALASSSTPLVDLRDEVLQAA